MVNFLIFFIISFDARTTSGSPAPLAFWKIDLFTGSRPLALQDPNEKWEQQPTPYFTTLVDSLVISNQLSNSINKIYPIYILLNEKQNEKKI